MKSDVLLLACVFEKFIKVSVNEFCINPIYCVSLLRHTWQCALKYTGKILRALQDKDIFSTVEYNIRGGISSVMGDRYVKSIENKKIIYADANILYGHSMSQPIPYDEIEMWHGHPDPYMNKLEEVLNTPDDSDFGHFVDFDLEYLDFMKTNTKKITFCPEHKINHKEKYNDNMKKIEPKNYTKLKKLKCDWTDKERYLVHYRMLKFYVKTCYDS